MKASASAGVRRYHQRTKHSLESVRAGPHALDWDNKPVPFRLYRDLSADPLPLDPTPAGVSATAAVLGRGGPPAPGAPDRRALGRLLYFSLGIVRRRQLPDGRTISFRAAACTGALYHVDAFIACGDLPDLAAGLYHFGPHDFALRRLREGDVRGNLLEAAGGDSALAVAPVIVVLASTWWRNAWKYRARAWRHVFWDGGTILSQLIAQAFADGWPTRLVCGFADPLVEELCGLDPRREGALALVAVGAGLAVPPPRAVSPLALATEPLSARETEFPPIAEAQRASSLADGGAVRQWRNRSVPPGVFAAPGPIQLLPSFADGTDPLEKVILRRGSTRAFSHRAISASALSLLLEAGAAGLAADFRSDPGTPLVDTFVVVHAVDGVAPGAYRWQAGSGRLSEIRRGSFRREAAFLDLGQPLAGDAAVNVYFLADLDRVLGALGERGYRAAQLDGAIGGGRVYLGAYAQRLGATGLTFFDDDVASFFGLDPMRWGVMFLAAAGVPARF